MRWLRSFLFRLQPLFRRKKIEAELADELRSHLEFATEAHLAAGLSPADARRAAERELGGLEQIKDSYRDQRSLPWLDQLQQDLRAAFRSLRKTPGFTAVAVLSLAVAIGVNTTVFSLVNALLLRPLAPLRPDELVTPYLSETTIGYRPFTHAEYLALRSARDTFSDVAATFPTFAAVADTNGLHRGVAFFASENYFAILGVTPRLGRFFTAEECRPNANLRVLVTSHAFWQRLGGRADFVGSTLRVNGQPYTVIGVAPRRFDGLNVLIATDCWAPLGVFSTFGGSAFGQATPDLAAANSYTLFLTARLASGLTLDSAARRLPAVALQLPQAAHPLKLETTRPDRQNIGPFPVGRDPTTTLALAFIAVAACVLLIAGFNLGNMLLARGADRAKEIALRTALGATRARIVRQLLTEGLLLALAGGATGFLLTLWTNRALYHACAQLNSSVYTLALNLQPDLRVFAATVGCALFVTLVFSFLPALKASRVDLVRDLKQHGATESASPHRLGRFFAWRHVVLMLQIALSLAVVFAATLFAHGALAAGQAPLGFDPSGGVVVELDFSLKGTPFAEAERAVSAALARTRTQPGVITAAATTLLPYGNMGAAKNVEPAVPVANASTPVAAIVAHYAAVTPGYLDALGVRLLRGRDFTTAEGRDPSAAYVAIIDESLARRLFPNGDALGQRIREPGAPKYSPTPSAGAAPEFEVVGICSPHRHELQGENQAALYVPLAAQPDHRGSLYLQVRYAFADPAALAASLSPLRAALLAGDADLPLTQVAPFSALIAQHAPLWMARVGAVLLGTIGAIALLLAVIGVYGVKSYAVARRTREIGIRLALGASPRTAFALIFRQAFFQIALALAVGSLLALAADRLLGSFVYGISGTDPLALAAAALVLALATLAATWLPARRATRVDPILALRCE